MTTSISPAAATPARRFLRGTTVIAGLAAVTLAASGGAAHAAVSAVGLGTASSFAVLAGAGITNTGPTTVTGDLGTFPTTSITGAASVTINGTNNAGNGVTQGAKGNLLTAYNTAAGEGPTTPIVADLGGQTLVAGVYNSASSIGLTGTLTLDGAGNPNAVFVFQAGSTLTTASASAVNLINSAQACNVFWQIGSSATLGTGSSFTGTIMALTDITVTTGVHIDGRVLARNGAVTLDTDVITRSVCAAAATTTPTTSTTATTTAVPTVSKTPTATVKPTVKPTATSATTKPATTSRRGTASAVVSATSGSQVSATPVGGVHAGDGSTSGGATSHPYGLALAGAATGLVLVLRTRRRASRR